MFYLQKVKSEDLKTWLKEEKKNQSRTGQKSGKVYIKYRPPNQFIHKNR